MTNDPAPAGGGSYHTGDVIQIRSGSVVVMVADPAEVERVRGGSAGVLSHSSAIPTTAAPTSRPRAVGRVRVRTMGEINVWVDGQEKGPLIRQKRIKPFILLYLLICELRWPGRPVSRTTLSDEAYPGVAPEQQRASVRQQLYEIRQMDPIVDSVVKVEGECVRLDLTGCDVDARRLLDLAAHVGHLSAPLSDDALNEVEAALVRAAEDFLPDWETIDYNATRGNGNASEIVTDLRARLEACHLVLLKAHADTCRWRREPERAIPYLRQALSRFPAEDDVVLKLIEAHEQAGQWRAADRLRAEYSRAKAS